LESAIADDFPILSKGVLRASQAISIEREEPETLRLHLKGEKTKGQQKQGRNRRVLAFT
jgi:hypothetical protein